MLVAVLLVLAVLVGIRVGFAAWISASDPGAVRSPDTSSYVQSARSLVETGQFDQSPDSDVPMFVRTPGYPGFVAAVLGITDSLRLVSIVQAAVSLVAAALIGLVAWRLLGRTAAVVAVLLIAIDPVLFATSGTLLTEALAAIAISAIAAAGLLVFVPSPDKAPVWGAAVLGASVAVATLVRPTTYYLPVFIVVLLVVRFRPTCWRRRLLATACFLLPLLVLVGGWQWRNHREVDSWRLSGIDAINLYCYRGAGVEADVDGTSIQTIREANGCILPDGRFDPAEGCAPWWNCPRDLADPAGPYFDEMASRGISTLIEHPVATTKTTVEGFFKLFGPGSDTVSRYLGVTATPPLSAALAVWSLGMFVAAGAGVWLLRRHPDRMYWIFVITVLVYYLAVSSGQESFSRLRAPVIPLLALLAAPAIERLIRVVLRDRRTGTTAANVDVRVGRDIA